MFNSFKARVLLWILGLIIVATFSTGISSYIIMYQALEESQKSNLLYVAKSEAGHLASFVDIREQKLKSIALSNDVLRYSQTFSGNVFFGYLDKFKEDFPVLSFVLEQGQEEIRIENGINSTRLTNISDSKIFNSLINEPNKIFDQVLNSPQFTEPQVVMGYHRKSFFDVFEGIIIGRIPFSYFFKQFNKLTIGKTGFLMLVDDQGTVLVHAQQSEVMTKVRAGNQDSEKLLSQAVGMQSGYGRATLLGLESFIAYAPVKGRNWSLIAVMPYSEFIEAPNELTAAFISFFIIISILSIAVSLYIASAVTTPVLSLIDSSNKLARGDLTQRVVIKTGNELGQLSQSFNLLAESLEASKSELEVVAENREQLIEELESKNAELGRFTYTVSHDLKSPLVTVKGFIGFLKNDLAKGDYDRVNKDLEQIAFASDNMSALLDDLLELSRVGRLMNKLEKIKLNELFEHVTQLLSGKIIETKAIIHLQSNMPLIYADRKRMIEVAQNLLENAIKFKQEDVVPVIHVTASQSGDITSCCVQDNGIGIEPEYYDLIFGLFERLDQKIEGTGIGLALIKRIIEVHKGKLTIHSEGKGRGTRFCFSLPSGEQSLTSI